MHSEAPQKSIRANNISAMTTRIPAGLGSGSIRVRASVSRLMTGTLGRISFSLIYSLAASRCPCSQ